MNSAANVLFFFTAGRAYAADFLRERRAAAATKQANKFREQGTVPGLAQAAATAKSSASRGVERTVGAHHHDGDASLRGVDN